MHPQDKQFFLIERLHRPNILWRFWLKVLFRSSWSNFLSREGLTSSQEKERQRDQERKLREQMWNMFVYSPSPPTTHLEVIRAVRHAPLLSLLPGPPPPTWVLSHWNSQRPQHWISVMASNLEVMSMWTDIGQWWWSLFVSTNFL
jgi:hypothetical protein